MLSRTFFCEECFKRSSPQAGDMFAVYGSTNRRLWVYEIDHKIPFIHRGFTPHTFVKSSEVDGIVLLEVTCCIHGCGVYITYNKKYTVSILRRKIITMKKEDYEALLSHSDFGYNIS